VKQTRANTPKKVENSLIWCSFIGCHWIL